MMVRGPPASARFLDPLGASDRGALVSNVLGVATDTILTPRSAEFARYALVDATRNADMPAPGNRPFGGGAAG